MVQIKACPACAVKIRHLYTPCSSPLCHLWKQRAGGRARETGCAAEPQKAEKAPWLARPKMTCMPCPFPESYMSPLRRRRSTPPPLSSPPRRCCDDCKSHRKLCCNSRFEVNLPTRYTYFSGNSFQPSLDDAHVSLPVHDYSTVRLTCHRPASTCACNSFLPYHAHVKR